MRIRDFFVQITAGFQAAHIEHANTIKLNKTLGAKFVTCASLSNTSVALNSLKKGEANY